jgi:hypothetical protein
MRGLLVVNPKATTTSARTREVLAGALRSEMALTVGFTRGRGHANDLATKAIVEGYDVVVVLGGDGHGQRGRQRADGRQERAPADARRGTGRIHERLRPRARVCRRIRSRRPARSSTRYGPAVPAMSD